MEAEMVMTKSENLELEIPGLSWPSWRWLDEMLHEGEWRQSFKIEEFTEDNSVVVRAELPGVDPDKDVQVDLWTTRW